MDHVFGEAVLKSERLVALQAPAVSYLDEQDSDVPVAEHNLALLINSS
jgi:hypothetical protein